MNIRDTKPYSLINVFLKEWNPINFPYQTEKDKQFLYVIKNDITGIYKIGITNNYEQRMIEIRNATGSPISLIILVIYDSPIDAGSIWVEHFLHNYFREKRTFGEWFKLSIKDIASIRSFFNYELDIGEVIFEAPLRVIKFGPLA